jgi:ATP-dependent RNA helicase HelY
MTLTPAERFAAAKRRAAQSKSEFATFSHQFDFELDPFQQSACIALESGKTVLVAAPTGAGKTVVGEFACHLALKAGAKCFYTTPIKALSNQKFADLCEMFGAENVGLLTGDNSLNSEAPIVVMTTEVLRNMLYAGSNTLKGLSHVVMDEVHYLADRFRGGVWEEVIIHLAESVSVVALSATVSNAEEFGDWLRGVRGETEIVVSEARPVPLWQHVLTNDRLYDLFIDDDQVEINPELVALARQDQEEQRLSDKNRRYSGQGGNHRRGRGSRGYSHREPDRFDEVLRLEREGLLPAIIFVFSRKGCDIAVGQLLRAGVRLTSERERAEIEAFAQERCAGIPPEDLAVLGYADFEHALGRGVAAHHAGMLPIFKEVVEELFTQGLVKVVFATETLALGINMPARSVVLERLVKWNGESHVEVTAGEYTQLTGRAGRRGIDVEGHAVVAWHRGLDPNVLAGLASTRTYPLNSSFKPSYNMAVNLVAQFGRDKAEKLLETSFAQFQADRSVVGLIRHQRRNDEHLAEYAASMTCHVGDFQEYSKLRRQLSDRESDLSKQGSSQRRAQAAASMEKLDVGDVIFLPTGRRSVSAVVIERDNQPRLDGPRLQVLTGDRQVKRLSPNDLLGGIESVARLEIPRNFQARNPQARKTLALALREVAPIQVSDKREKQARNEDEEILNLRASIRQHPCHGCDQREDHARWAERFWRVTRESDALAQRISGRTNSVGRTFRQVCEVLESQGYLDKDSDSTTPAGEILARIYSESDLLIAQALRNQVWDDLSPADLAATVSILVYESRRDNESDAPEVPYSSSAALAATVRLWADLERVEKQFGLSFLREPDLGLAMAAHGWASGKRLDSILKDSQLSAGDFVRVMRQLIDLLGQIADAGNSAISTNANAAIDKCRRGIIALTGL